MKSRLVFIDLLRGWATVVMIEVHVINAFVLPEIKQAGWFSVLNFINGMVAPSFLFVAGFVFIIASERKLDEFRSVQRAFWKQLGRIGVIWGVGYLMHLPFFSLSRTVRETTAEGWLQFYQADILHCIAVGLFVLFLARMVIKRTETFQRFLSAVAIGTVLLAPLVWEVDFLQLMPAPFAAYMNGQHYSQFPLFNWLGFLMVGGWSAISYARAKAENREQHVVQSFLWLGAGLTAAGSLLIELPISLPDVSTAIRANPFFFLTRLGIVFLLMVVCWHYVERRKTERSFVLDVSRESLLVYVAHLLVIYGTFWNNHSLAFLYGHTLTLLQAVALTFGLTAAMVLLATVWSRLKQRSLQTARTLSYATGILFVILFIVRQS